MATDYTVGVRFTGNASSLNQATASAATGEREVGHAGQQAGDQANAGFGRARAGVESISRTLDRTRQQFLAFIGVTQLINVGRGVARMADDYANIGARLKLAADGTVSFADAQRQALAVAQATGAELGTTSELIGKLATSFRSLGGEAKTSFTAAVDLSQTISQAVALSGASAGAAQAAITQLGQGLASGTLRGDELNSVLEQTPRLAQAIAEGMGVTVGQLRALGAQGEITAKQIVGALQTQQRELATEYSQLPLTIGRAWTLLQNSVLSYIGQADQARGASRKVADSIAFIASHVDDIARAVIALGQVVATVYATKVIYSGLAWIANLRAQSAAVAANGVAVQGWAAKTSASFAAARANIGLLGIAFNVVGSAIVGWQIGSYLRDQFLVVRLGAIALVDGLLTAWERIKEGALIAWAAVGAAWDLMIAGIKSSMRGAIEIFANVLRGNGNDAAAQWFDNYAASIKTTSSALQDFDATSKQVHAAADKAVAAIHANTDGMMAYEKAQEAAKTATEGNTAAQADQGSAIEALLKQLKNGAAAALSKADADKAAAAAARDLARANAEIASGQDSLDEQIMQQRDRLAGLTQQQIAYNAGIRETAQLYAGWIRAGVPLDQAQAALIERQRALNEILQNKNQIDAQDIKNTPEKVKSYGTQTDAAERYYQVIKDGAKTAADTIANYFVRQVRSVKDLWRGLADAAKSVVAQIISIWLQLRVLQPLLAGVFGGGGGGSMWGQIGNYFVRNQLGGGGGGGGLMGGGGGGGASGGGGSYGNMLSNINMARNAYSWMFGGAGAAASTIPAGVSGGAFAANAGGTIGGNMGATLGGAYVPAGSPALAAGYGQAPLTPYGGSFTAGGYAVPYASIGGGLLGAYYGSQRGGGGISTVASTVSYGALGAGIAGTAAGVAGGASLGAAAGGAFGAAAGASWIPVVGWVLAAMALVDMVSGGKLFGTKYKTAASDATLRIGAEGGEASASLYQTKQRALFGGRKTRVVDQAVTPELQAAADSLYEGVRQTMTQAAQKLAINVPTMIEASLNTHTTYNDKGQVRATEYVVGYLGRTWKEATADAAAQRLGAEALVKVVQASAGDVAQTIAEQFRSSADTLLDGAQAMLAAQADITKGTSLVALGSSATLAQVIAFAKTLQADGEKLADTYARLAQASAQYLQFVSQFEPAATGFGGSLQAIANQMQANIDQANALAQAAGLQHAREADLANIHQQAAQQAAAAIAQLSAAAQDLVTKLYDATGDSLAAVNAQLARLHDRTASALQLALGDKSPMTDQEKLQLALQGLRSGLTSADDVLSIGRNLYASGSDYNNLFAQVQGIAGLPGGTGQPSLQDALSQYSALFAKQQDLQAQANAAARTADARTLAQYVADISTTHGIGYNEVASGLGFTLPELAKDLGVTDVTQYLDQLKLADVPGTVLDASSSIVSAIQQLGRDLISSITGAPITGATVTAPPATPNDPQVIALLQQINQQLQQQGKTTRDQLGQIVQHGSDTLQQQKSNRLHETLNR